jgi:hypothetical protein
MRLRRLLSVYSVSGAFLLPVRTRRRRDAIAEIPLASSTSLGGGASC